MILALLTPAFAEPVLQIKVPDASIAEVVLTCPGRTVRTAPRNGIAYFTEVVENCKVQFVENIGRIGEPGVYTCDGTGCTKQGVVHRNVEAAPSRVSIVLTDKSATFFELTCPSGYRERATVVTNTAVFDNVPDEPCTLYFKGAGVANVKDLRHGAWTCSALGGAGRCARR